MELKAKLKLNDLKDSENINEILTEEDSKKIGLNVVSTFDTDKESRRGWEKKMKDAEELALQIKGEKAHPFRNASNVKFPLLTIAAMQFQARAYPALVKAPNLVKFRKQGRDDGKKAARAERVSAHMSYQLLEEDEVWEEDHDKALLVVPILGCAFKKTYYDKVKGHNCSTLVLPKNLVIHYYAKSIEDCARKTEIFELYPNQIKERQLRGVFSDFDLPTESVRELKSEDKRQGTVPPTQDKDAARELLEQHCYLDLDGDGYKEPYVVTVHKDSAKVYRIVSRFEKIKTEQSVEIEELQTRIKALAEGLQPVEQPTAEDLAQLQRAEETITAMQTKIEFLAQQKPKVLKIDPVEYYTKIPFIPSPDGGFYDIGLGQLLGDLGSAVNTLINQLIDAGTWANSNTGFIGKGARIPGGALRFVPNELKRVNVAGSTLKESIVMMDFNEPSSVLFQLLGLLITYSERVGSVTDAMVGENPGQNTPAYNMSAMLEQGLQVFNGIFKRVYRSMRSEFRKLYKLNAIYLDEETYFTYHDSDITVLKTDYTGDTKDLIPAADPNAFSNKEKMDKASIILQRADSVPGYDPVAKELRWLEAMDIPDVDEVFPRIDELDESGQPTGNKVLKFPPQPDPEMEIKKADMQRRTLEGKVRGEVDVMKAESQIMVDQAKVMVMIAELEADEKAEENKVRIEDLKLLVKEFEINRKTLVDMAKIANDKQKANSRVEG